MRSLVDVLREHSPHLLQIPGVVGTGEGRLDGRSAFLVLVTRAEATLVSQLPSEIEGYPVQIRETGEVRGLG